MNYWIFIVTNQKADGIFYPAKENFQMRMNDKFWGLGEKTPNRKYLEKGDKIVFYVGIPEKIFAGEATLSTNAEIANEEVQRRFSHGKQIFTPEYGVYFENISVWDNPVSTDIVIPNLDFIENKTNWGAYFQGGVRQISEKDYRTIVSRTSKPLQNITEDKDVESLEMFALESHLEEFLYQNWSLINWGKKLKLYQTEDQNGRQFPAGIWSIDFLAIDEETNDLYIIELKRGKTSDATVGQTLRYIGWIEKNLAEKNQKVFGIIVAKGIDDALKYSVNTTDKIIVKTYNVKFILNSVNM